jgi:hypothetical protein
MLARQNVLERQNLTARGISHGSEVRTPLS